MVNLFIALFWLILGLGFFFVPFFVPTFPRWRIVGTDWSIGWLAIGLAAYNLVRWWLFYRQQSRRPELSADEPPPTRPREYNPEFDFTKDRPEEK